MKDRDDEGEPIYRVAVSLRSGEVVPPSRVWSHRKEEQDRAAQVVQDFLAGFGVCL